MMSPSADIKNISPCCPCPPPIISLQSRFSGDKGGKRPWCLTSSSGVKNAGSSLGAGTKSPGRLSLSPSLSLLPSFWSRTHGDPRELGGILIRILDRPNLEGSPQSLLSQRRGPSPKKQNLCSLNCWLRTKGGSPWLFFTETQRTRTDFDFCLKDKSGSSSVPV